MKATASQKGIGVPNKLPQRECDSTQIPAAAALAGPNEFQIPPSASIVPEAAEMHRSF